MTKCVDCNKEIDLGSNEGDYGILKGVHYGSIDRRPRCGSCSGDYEDGVYIMSDW